MARVLLLLPTKTYRATDFLEAARRLGVEVTVASEEKNVLESQNPTGYLDLDFEDLERCSQSVVEFSKKHPFDAVLGMDDSTMVAAAAISIALGLRSNSVEAVKACRDKHLMRQRLQNKGLTIPMFRAFPVTMDAQQASLRVPYPCVLKPTRLSASQGVIRANDPNDFVQAWKRITRIIESLKSSDEILVEEFIPGKEIALEGLLEDGRLSVLALFDKPDPLDGPFFEETLYVQPSRLPKDVQNRIFSCAEKGTGALGLETGPIHAELRINQRGPWIIEIAARPIGGRCSRALRFGLDISLEEVILRHALGWEAPRMSLNSRTNPSGVMMIPIPRAGKLKHISGVKQAEEVAGVKEILLNSHIGDVMAPLPEGSAYLGFIIARGETPENVEKALREAHRCLEFDVEPLNHEPTVPTLSHCVGG